jgi:nitrate/nitrite transport system substrate-binding protein
MDRLTRLILYLRLSIDNMKHTSEISRRKFILTAGATAMVGLGLKGCTTNSGGQLTPIRAANVNGGGGIETTKARIGFIGQTDAAPLVIAKVKELFAKHGVPDVELVKQPSWGGN